MQAFNKILVTGGTGFIGAYIIKALVEKGYRVKAIRRSNTLPFFIDAALLQQVEWVSGDVLDIVALENAMQDCDAVIHAAAMVSFTKEERMDMYKTNVDGTANVVNTCLLLNIKKLLYVSSVAALGRTAAGDEVTEEKKWEPSKINTHYAISKHMAEMELWRAVGEGLNAVVINPSTVLGFGDWKQSSSAIFRNVYNEFPWYTNGINGFVAVEDVANAAVLLLESTISNQRFIVNGENWSFKQLFTSIADGLQKKHPTKEATPFLGEIAWRLEKIKALFTGNKPLLTKESARVAHSKTYFSNQKILAALPGFSFTPLQTAIAAACKKYVNHYGAGNKN
jgi:dihydroflavonol-4-reductase